MTRVGTTEWDTATDHARDAARSLYVLGALAAAKKVRVSYQDASTYLKAASKGYGGRRSVLPLNALAGLCMKLNVPDLSSVFWSEATICITDPKDPRRIPRWIDAMDKLDEEKHCFEYTYPSLEGEES